MIYFSTNFYHFLHRVSVNTFTQKAKEGVFKGLNNAKLREYGNRQEFYPGIPDFIKEIKSFLKDNDECIEYNVKVENYIVSTGFAEVIKGIELSEMVERIWGSELLESEDCNGQSIISDICYIIDNTTKTRALFEI